MVTQFKIKLIESSFIQKEEISIPESLFEFVNDNLPLKRNYVSENPIREAIISPILNIVSKHNNIPLWSHIRFNS